MVKIRYTDEERIPVTIPTEEQVTARLHRAVRDSVMAFAGSNVLSTVETLTMAACIGLAVMRYLWANQAEFVAENRSAQRQRKLIEGIGVAALAVAEEYRILAKRLPRPGKVRAWKPRQKKSETAISA